MRKRLADLDWFWIGVCTLGFIFVIGYLILMGFAMGPME